MAKAPGHKLGQVVGTFIERFVASILGSFAAEHGYFLDTKGPRGKARPGKKITWADKYGSSHDLDFVLEKAGTADVRGRPVAFIEVAWRGGTRHSRNKAQEIQGAVLPIAEKHVWDMPFLGAVIAGNFTDGASDQMAKAGFQVLYIKYDSVVTAFRKIGIKIEFDDDTSDEDAEVYLEKIEALSSTKRNRFEQHLAELNKSEISDFIGELKKALSRYIEKILITPLFGSSAEFPNVTDAIAYLGKDIKSPQKLSMFKIDVLVCFSNGDKIDASFKRPSDARNFLDYVSK